MTSCSCHNDASIHGWREGRKLEVGSGPSPRQGYEHNDVNPGPGIDHVGAAQTLDFPDQSFVEVFATGALEHLVFIDAVTFLKKALRWLVPGGCLDINVPDTTEWMKDLVQHRKPKYWVVAAFEGWCRWPGDEHKSFWTEDLLVKTLSLIGYERVTVYSREAYGAYAGHPASENWHVCVQAFRPTGNLPDVTVKPESEGW